VVKIEALTKSFGAHPLFKDLTLEFPQGSLTVIMGASGCGKSTLLRCINFLEMFDSGKISIGELSVGWNEGESTRLPADKKLALQKMRLKTGMVFQSFNLFPHLTALENVTLAPMQVKKIPSPEASLMGKRILDRVGLAQKVNAYPSQLSGGQQQRVAIARSLAMQPEVMLYDEPTSQLDPQLVDEVFNVMRELDREGMTQIVVTHHEPFARETGCKVLRFANGGFQWTN
jgi:ABC-type polar amino acid transport system ATPase subunit